MKETRIEVNGWVVYAYAEEGRPEWVTICEGSESEAELGDFVITKEFVIEGAEAWLSEEAIGRIEEAIADRWAKEWAESH